MKDQKPRNAGKPAGAPTDRKRVAKGAGGPLSHIVGPLRGLAVEIESLTHDPGNVRRHGERNLAAITESLRQFGQQAPVLFVRRGRQLVVIKGNGMLQAARALGWKRIAAVESHLAGADATAFAIADNRTTDLSDFDEALLAAQLQELEEAEYDIAAAGFSDEELQKLVDSVDDPRGRLVGDDAPGPSVELAYVVIAHCPDETSQRALFNRLRKEGLKCRLSTL
jgi:ParB-like chromosome segregation protein Spo0J